MKHIFKSSLVFITLSLLLTRCNNKASEETIVEVVESNLVTLTDGQFKTSNILLGNIETKSLSGTIKVNGLLDVPPQNLVSVSTPMGGILKSTDLLQGMHVVKGQVIALIQNTDFIKLQQDYLDYKSQLEFLETDFKRQEELAKENVNSQKVLSQAKTHYQSMLAKVGGLKSTLNLLGINISNLNATNFQSTISVVAPITGYVTQVPVNIGMNITPNEVMFKIVDTEHLHAELTVFEKDIPKIKIGQKVRFTLSNESEERTAVVHLIGREIKSDRTVNIHCHLDKEDLELIPGMYLKAIVETQSQNVSALPNSAIVEFEGNSYVFISNNNKEHQYSMLKITTGLSQNGFTEIAINKDINTDTKIVINGAYDVLAKMKNQAEEE